MKTKKLMNMMLAAAVTVSMTMTTAGAAKMPTDPIGGKPPAGSKVSVKDLDYQVKYQRAFETVIWSMPAVAIYGFTRGAFAIGADNNTILAFSKPATPYTELLTANNVTPYIFSQTDLRKGPVVVDVPAATDKASFYGQIVDHWQIAMAGVGPSGIDKGKGGKILLTPPGYNGKVPAGYMHVESPSYRVNFVFRSIKGPNATTADAVAYSKKVKMYYLNNPTPTRFIDPSDKRLSTLPFYDERWFDDVHAVFSVENVKPEDKVMMGMLASLGIEKGKPYNPDAKTKKAMRNAVVDAYHHMQKRILHTTDRSRDWWQDRHWSNGIFADKNHEFSYVYDNLIDIDNRADRYFIGTYYPPKVGPQPATQYMFALADADGNEFQAGKSYSFTMPAKAPIKQFWSLIVYDLETYAFIYTPEGRIGLSSANDMKTMQKNKDGSITLYFGPKAPKGKKSNWIPTSGYRPLPVLRVYGGTEKFWDKSWKMPDVKLVK
ncbi:MAG: DUF1254 domain-containing protein [Xanthomonadales bacterium]|nr:DUF1254 domain-containing protein [Xanthomonadales bacterium]